MGREEVGLGHGAVSRISAEVVFEILGVGRGCNEGVRSESNH